MGTQEMIYAAFAAVIAGLLLFSVSNVQLRGQEASIDAVQYRAAKTKMLVLAEVMQRDFSNIGANMYKNGGGFITDVLDPTAIITSTGYEISDVPDIPGAKEGYFEFLSQQDSMAAPVTIRYEWEPIEDEEVTLENGTTRQLYRMRRIIGGNVTMEYDLLTSFNVSLLTDDEGSVPILTNLELTRVVDLSLTAVSPVGKARFIEETVFEAAFRPTAMTIHDPFMN